MHKCLNRFMLFIYWLTRLRFIQNKQVLDIIVINERFIRSLDHFYQWSIGKNINRFITCNGIYNDFAAINFPF